MEKLRQAKTLLRTLQTRRHALSSKHPATFSTMNDLAILYRKQLLYNEVENLLIEPVKGRCHKLGDTHTHTLESLENLIALYQAWNKPEKAKAWRAKLLQIEVVIK